MARVYGREAAMGNGDMFLQRLPGNFIQTLMRHDAAERCVVRYVSRVFAGSPFVSYRRMDCNCDEAAHLPSFWLSLASKAIGTHIGGWHSLRLKHCARIGSVGIHRIWSQWPKAFAGRINDMRQTPSPTRWQAKVGGQSSCTLDP